MKKPQDYQKRILLAVSGMSPAILTETLYSIACVGSQPFIPTEIHLITTLKGAHDARLQLLHAETGHFYGLCREYQLPEIRFDETTIHVLEGQDGTKLDDVMTPEDNSACADFIMDIVRTFCADKNLALHVSIAGGRKTMGYYLGYMLSLFGRQQDRLSHVLVDAPYEKCPDFFYPTRHSKVMHTRDKRPIDAKDCTVRLAQIPFLRISDRLTKLGFNVKSSSFSEVITAAQAATTVEALFISLPNKSVQIGENTVPLSPVPLAFLAWVVQRSLQQRPIVRPPEPVNYNEWELMSQVEAPDYLARDTEEWFRIFIAASGDNPDTDWNQAKWQDHETYKRIRTGLNDKWWDDCRSQLLKALKEVLNDKKRAELYLPKKLTSEGFVLDIPHDMLQLEL